MQNMNFTNQTHPVETETDLCSGGDFFETVGGRHGERGARVYTGGLGAEPPAGSSGRAPGQGIRGAKPHWSWKKIEFW